VRYGEATHFVLMLGAVYAALGMAHAQTGDLESALKYVEKGIQLCSDTGVRNLLSMYYAYLGLVHSLSGDLKSAQRDEEEALKLAQEGKNKMLEGFSQIFLGSILGAADASRSAEAEEHILQGIKLLEELKLRPMCSMGYFYLGQHYASKGHREEALQTLKKAESAFQEMGMDFWASMAQLTLGTVTGQ